MIAVAVGRDTGTQGRLWLGGPHHQTVSPAKLPSAGLPINALYCRKRKVSAHLSTSKSLAEETNADKCKQTQRSAMSSATMGATSSAIRDCAQENSNILLGFRPSESRSNARKWPSTNERTSRWHARRTYNSGEGEILGLYRPAIRYTIGSYT